MPSINKKKNRPGGFYFHATDDIPEIRKLFYDLINTVNCSFEAVVARKSIERFATKHKHKEDYFYADLLSHLLKDKFGLYEKLILNISERGQSTKHNNLNIALEKAKERFAKTDAPEQLTTNVRFNVQAPTKEPLLNIADYLCWAVQRVFEKGEIRYYNLVMSKIDLVIDLYDKANYPDFQNYYDNKTNPLTAGKKISPQIH